MFHHDAVHVSTCKLLFESDDVGAIFAARLKIYFTIDLLLQTFVKTAECDHLHGKDFIGRTMLCLHYRAKGSIAQFLDQIILVELILVTLHSQ